MFASGMNGARKSMGSEKSLRVISYRRRSDLSSLVAAAADIKGVEIEHSAVTVRVALTQHVLETLNADAIADLVVKIVGSEHALNRDMVIQPKAESRELSVTIIDADDRPMDALQSEAVSVRDRVMNFLQQLPV